MCVRSTCRGIGSLEIHDVDTRELHEDVLQDAQGDARGSDETSERECS